MFSTMAPPLIQLQDVGLTFGGTPLLAGVDLTIAAGERLCLVGRNGSGKSTLLRIAAGLIEPDRGTRFLQPGVTIRYLPQEPDFADATTTLAYVEAGLAPGDDVHQARYLLQQLGLGGDEDVARLSPLVFEHINLLGRYAFSVPDAVAQGHLRPLRNPADALDDVA